MTWPKEPFNGTHWTERPWDTGESRHFWNNCEGGAVKKTKKNDELSQKEKGRQLINSLTILQDQHSFPSSNDTSWWYPFPQMNHIDVHRASTRTCPFKENRFLLYPAKTSAFYHHDSVTFLGPIRLSKWLSYCRRHWQLSLWRRNWRWGCPAVRWFNTSQKHNGVCMCLPKTAAGLALAWLIACVSDRRVGLVMIFGCGSTAAVPAFTETKLHWRYSEWHWIDPSVLPVTGGVSERGMVCFWWQRILCVRKSLRGSAGGLDFLVFLSQILLPSGNKIAIDPDFIVALLQPTVSHVTVAPLFIEGTSGSPATPSLPLPDW